MRIDTVGDIRMPPLARETIDRKGVQLLGEWINSLPGTAGTRAAGISPRAELFACGRDFIEVERTRRGNPLHLGRHRARNDR